MADLCPLSKPKATDDALSLTVWNLLPAMQDFTIEKLPVLHLSVELLDPSHYAPVPHKVRPPKSRVPRLLTINTPSCYASLRLRTKLASVTPPKTTEYLRSRRDTRSNNDRNASVARSAVVIRSSSPTPNMAPAVCLARRPPYPRCGARQRSAMPHRLIKPDRQNAIHAEPRVPEPLREYPRAVLADNWHAQLFCHCDHRLSHHGCRYRDPVLLRNRSHADNSRSPAVGPRCACNMLRQRKYSLSPRHPHIPSELISTGLPITPCTRTRAHTRAHARTRTHTHAHARAHTRTHVHTRTRAHEHA